MTSATKTPVQLFEDAKQRLNVLQQRKTRADSVVLAEQAQLDRARAEAQELLGTTSAEELRKKYAEAHSENLRVVTEVLTEIEAREKAFDEIDRALAAANQPAA